MIVQVDDIYIAHRVAIPLLQHTDLVSISEACMKARLALAIARDEVYAQLTRLIAIDDRSSLRPGLPVTDLMRLLENGLQNNRLIAYSGSSALIAYKLSLHIHPCPAGLSTAWHSSSMNDVIGKTLAKHAVNLKNLTEKAKGNAGPEVAQHLHDEITDALSYLKALSTAGVADMKTQNILGLVCEAVHVFAYRALSDLADTVGKPTANIPSFVASVKILLGRVRDMQNMGLPSGDVQKVLAEIPAQFGKVLKKIVDDLKLNLNSMKMSGLPTEQFIETYAKQMMKLVADSVPLGMQPNLNCIAAAIACATELLARSRNRFKNMLALVANKTMTASDPRLKGAATELVTRKQNVNGLGGQANNDAVDDTAKRITQGLPVPS